jgi:uncharacterized membrane protein
MGGRDAETQIGVIQRWRIRHRDYAPHLNVHLDRDQELTLQTLVSLGPEMLAFALTFVIVGVYWVSHHSMMHMIKAVDRRLLWLNLLLLLAVVFIPFPAYLLGRHMGRPLGCA